MTEEPSLADDLMAMDNANAWDGPLWVTGTVAHCFSDCRDMKPTAKPYHGIDPHIRRNHGVNACRHCLDRWEQS